MKHKDLFKKMQELRLAATSIYDKLKTSGAKEEDIQKSIVPFQTKMQDLIEHSVLHDLQACVTGSKEFRENAKACDEMARYYIQKSMDAKQHADNIETAIVQRMVKENVDQLSEGLATATLVSAIDGSKVLNLR